MKRIGLIFFALSICSGCYQIEKNVSDFYHVPYKRAGQQYRKQMTVEPVENILKSD